MRWIRSLVEHWRTRRLKRDVLLMRMLELQHSSLKPDGLRGRARHLPSDALRHWRGRAEAEGPRDVELEIASELRLREAWAAPGGWAVCISLVALAVSIVALIRSH